MQVPRLNPRQGETVPLGDDSIAKAVAALPFAGNTVGAALVSYPRLSRQAYASLRGETGIGGRRAVGPERGHGRLQRCRPRGWSLWAPP